MEMPDNVNDCIHCNRCIKKCDFLTKYNIDLHSFSQREELAYNCFLCNDCKIVCPKDIDGTKISLALRSKQIDSDNRKNIEKKYKALLFEKNDYIFKNYKNSKTKSVLFPGCNFSSFYPDALKHIANVFKNEYDIGIVFDCCGKPVYELGIDNKDSVIKLENNMLSNDIDEIITLCPNCYYFLNTRLNIRVVTIYEKMYELGYRFDFKHINENNKINLFIPCPDKESKHIKKSILKLINLDENYINEIKDVNCCGLGGCAISNEKEIANNYINKLKEKDLDNLYVYCATCAGNFNRNKIQNIYHFLIDIFEMNNFNIKNKSSLLNRALFKFY